MLQYGIKETVVLAVIWLSFCYLAFSKSIMLRPVTLPCGHSACRNCYRRLLEIEEQKSKTTALCPECRKHFGRESLIVSYAMDRVTSSLEVQCLNEDCEWKGQLGEAEDHNRQCPRQAKISCPLLVLSAGTLMQGEGCLSRRQKSSLTIHSLSFHARERKSERREREARKGGGWV